MKFIASPVALLVIFVAAPACADSLSVRAGAVTTTIRPSASNQVRLPALEIETSGIVRCANDTPPISLTLSSADVLQQVPLDEVGQDGDWRYSFALPADQVPPLVARGFCAVDASEGQALALRKPAFLSLRANARCSGDTGSRLTTETALVDVVLVCEREADDAAQESSE